MDKNLLLQQPKKYTDDFQLLKRRELLKFAKEQFRELTQKNLRIPVKLYHL